MRSLMVFLVCSLISYDVGACPSAGQIAEINVALKIQTHKGVWPGFANKRLVFAFIDQTTHATQILGVTQNELDRIGIASKKCDLGSGIESFEISGVTLPANGLYDIRLSKQPGTDVLGEYTTKYSQPVVLIQQPNNYGLDSIYVARTAIHEAFHGIYQFDSGDFKVIDPQPRDFLKSCSGNVSWTNSTLKQNNLLSASLHTKDLKQLNFILSAIEAEREILAKDEITLSCLLAQRFWERLEGSAHYVETESAIQAGLLKKEDLVAELEKVLLATSVEDDFFYRSGSTLIRLLVAVNGSGTFNEIDRDNFMIVP